jgi:hypothetical protein
MDYTDYDKVIAERLLSTIEGGLSQSHIRGAPPESE